ncbi:hypothetical protein D3273_20125 [Lichenibacterium minor]|uniref:Uncharacterized protein n=1 Tax=Lichenibacterium minor TaxID=2316528 RepID=A0A4Q2U163_9HYPH|nr:hypothetical protein [Lichenibacterium minor]RYC30183.1 hypothetical protein D3273_20125 [Lichenibacterium minor]
MATLQETADLLAAHRLDAFATNDAILFQMADGLPGSRVVAGRWGAEHFAAAVAKGRRDGMPFLQAFVAHAGRDGTVARAIARAGLRGTVPAGG